MSDSLFSSPREILLNPKRPFKKISFQRLKISVALVPGLISS
ncbi:MAG: hypothetical protein RI601_09915 [Desulfurivibrionaceae bacterium]|nr:hypothetical protein [Desulfurivibrionaceae bacterium]